MPFDGTQLDETTRILIAGREKIERGWCQGSAQSGGAVCILGAIRIRGPKCFHHGAMRSLEAVTGAPFNQLAPWNDAPGRTKAEVLGAFDRAIGGGPWPQQEMT